MPNPYLTDNRLQDVLAAITALAVYRKYKLTFAGWADLITGQEKNAPYLERVLREHPEFFRINSQDNMASLVWRRQLPHVSMAEATGRAPAGSPHEDEEDETRHPFDTT